MRTIKICPKCQVRPTTSYSGWCAQCAVDKRLEENRRIYDEARARGCTDCGLIEPKIMDFDHVPERGAKTFNIGSGLRGKNPKRFAAEVAKCDVVCPNCHRRRTLSRLE